MPTVAPLNRILNKAGLRSAGCLSKWPGRSKKPDLSGKSNTKFLYSAPQAHLQYAEFCFQEGLFEVAHSEMRTANFLGAKGDRVKDLARKLEHSLTPLEDIAHNQYYRLQSLANAIFAQGESLSVLDVGGGAGNLSRFIPNNPYCLAEPIVNGISGENLPFEDGSFDLVVSCHVLEHIPTSDVMPFWIIEKRKAYL
ncbi:MAG: class I SAM-dependent methyltransferase [Flavobacteriales bacterium]|nr:class I SAM-dependent methyltransferase [Flavobacteriales bacterium]